MRWLYGVAALLAALQLMVADAGAVSPAFEPRW